MYFLFCRAPAHTLLKLMIFYIMVMLNLYDITVYDYLLVVIQIILCLIILKDCVLVGFKLTPVNSVSACILCMYNSSGGYRYLYTLSVLNIGAL